jgi:hypothetical protein
MVQKNEIKRINDVLAEGIRARTHDPTLNDLLGLADVANGALYDILGAFTAAENLKAILGDLSTTKRLGQILGALDETNTLKAILGAYTAASPLKTALDNLKGATGIFHEQADVAVNITAIAALETNVFDLSAASTRYIVRHLRLKFADPSTETVTVRLYELINDVLTVVDTFTVDNTNFGTYFSLMDMFGVPHLAGDNLKVTVQVSGGAGVAVTGQYSYAKTNV